jgi:hypothetical protein
MPVADRHHAATPGLACEHTLRVHRHNGRVPATGTSGTTQAHAARDIDAALEQSVMPHGSLTIDFDWVPHGTVTADADTIRFESAPRIPGLYRIDLDEVHTYIGEARSLAARFNGYRNPGGSVETTVPRTNRRVQRQILAALSIGRSVPVSICTQATITIAGDTMELPFTDKTRRLLVESAAMILAERDGHTLENLHRR